MRFATLLLGISSLLSLSLGANSCRTQPDAQQTPPQEDPAVQPSIEEAQKELTPTVMALSGIVGIAIGLCGDEPCIKVLAVRQTTEMGEKIPSTYKGYQVVIEQTGEITAPPPGAP